MRIVAACFTLEATFMLCTALLWGPTARAQDVTGVDGLNQRQTLQRMLGDESVEQSAYKAFYDVKPEDLDKKIQLGQDFLQKYPKSAYAEAVDVGLTNAYYAKADWKDFYASADRALALKPDNVDVLTTVGWVIPHFYDPDEAGASAQLDKAEAYEKQALQLLETMPRPASLSEAQYAELKTQKAMQAHSALGLVYFRRSDYENSAKELQQSTEASKSPDQADLYVLGLDLQNLKRTNDARAAFTRCAAIPGALQDTCKQSAQSK
jgi:tetratricopeptide (TPR) repeat protein